MASHGDSTLDPSLPKQMVYFLMYNHSIPIDCFSLPPTAAQLPHKLDTVQLCIMGILTILTTISIILYLEEAVYLRKKMRCPVKRRTSLWSSAAPTLISIFTCLGLWIPRSAMFIEVAVNTYFAVCFYLIFMVILEGFGGKDAIVKRFEGSTLHINTGPCCCCCPCLPRITLTKRKVNVFIMAVAQLAFLKPAFNIIGVILWSDGIYNTEDILLILTTLQTSIFNILAGAGVLPCVPPYAFRTRATLMNSHLIIIETFILSILARIAYRRRDDEAGYVFKPAAV